MAVEGVDRVAQEYPVVLPVDADLDMIGVEEMAFQLFRVRSPDGDAKHLAEEFIADGGQGFGAQPIAKSERVMLDQLPA